MSETNRCEGPARTPVYYEDEPSEPLGAQCKNASSDASKLATQTDDDAKLRDYLRTKAIDPPLQDDVIGNLIPSALVGGAAGAVHHLALTSTAAGIGGAVAAHAAKDVAADAVKHAVVHSFKDSVDVTTIAPAAGASKNAASVPVKEPNESRPEPEPPPVGRDRSPYAPGAAPIRIPEVPMIIRG